MTFEMLLMKEGLTLLYIWGCDSEDPIGIVMLQTFQNHHLTLDVWTLMLTSVCGCTALWFVSLVLRMEPGALQCQLVFSH